MRQQNDFSAQAECLQDLSKFLEQGMSTVGVDGKGRHQAQLIT